MRTAQVYNKFQQVYDWANDSKINFKQKGKPEIYEKYKNDKQVNVNRFFLVFVSFSYFGFVVVCPTYIYRIAGALISDLIYTISYTFSVVVLS